MASMDSQEHLPCPRCHSTNTKFCYYNNYNLSQPRHFCKACRRYWTQGGTLRDIPVGGGSRKNAKRSRTVTCSSPLAPSVNVNVNMCGGNGSVSESFTSLLNNTQGSSGFPALGGFEGTRFGIGRAGWNFPGLMEGVNIGGRAWQLEGGEGGFVGGDCFSWPGLPISTPGNSLE